jgi:2-keto-4-pentenoate hydratase/2-oxohepta-3-ene-1,7-dioic acid hydratase in catechol pathway
VEEHRINLCQYCHRYDSYYYQIKTAEPAGCIRLKLARTTDHNSDASYILINNRQQAITRRELRQQTGLALPEDLMDVLSGELVSELEHALPALKFTEDISKFSLSFPIRDPPKLIFLNFNYKDQSGWIRFGRTMPRDPVFYLKPHTCLNGPYDEIRCPPFVRQLDFEGEMALVISKKCKNVSEIDAIMAVGGYFAMNDVSARDIQYTDIQVSRSKCFDTFAPCGPWITTRSEIPDPNNLRICTKVNGETRQDSSTANMVLRVEEIISKLSKVMTLEPGDIVSTGTPMGTVLSSGGKKPWLSDGDVVDVEIEKVGAIKNTICFE